MERNSFHLRDAFQWTPDEGSPAVPEAGNNLIPSQMWPTLAAHFQADVVIANHLGEGIVDTMGDWKAHYIDQSMAKDGIRAWLADNKGNEGISCGACEKELCVGSTQLRHTCGHWMHSACRGTPAFADDLRCVRCGDSRGCDLEKVPARSAGTAPGPSNFLLLSVNGTAAQSDIDIIRRAKADVNVILLGFATHAVGESLDSIMVPTLASRLWASRVTRMADEMACLGQPFSVATAKGRKHGSLIAITLQVKRVSTLLPDKPTTTVWTPVGAPISVRILVSRPSAGIINNLILEWVEDARGQGLHLNQTQIVIRPEVTKDYTGSPGEL